MRFIQATPRQIMAITPLDPLTVHNFLQDGHGEALSSGKEVME